MLSKYGFSFYNLCGIVKDQARSGGLVFLLTQGLLPRCGGGCVMRTRLESIRGCSGATIRAAHGPHNTTPPSSSVTVGLFVFILMTDYSCDLTNSFLLSLMEE